MLLFKVSIIIPTFNQDSFIDKAITSALNQDYNNLEVIVADDFSTDNTYKIIQKYKSSNLRYFRNEKNYGRVANYKRALYEYATGDWALCLDGDDYLIDPTYIRTCIEIVTRFAHEDKPLVFIQGGDKLIYKNQRTENVRLPKIPTEIFFVKGIEYFFRFTDYAHFSHLATFYDRHKAMEVGFYNDDILSADMESFLKLSLHGNVVLYKKVAGVWLQHGSNASSTNNIPVLLNNLRWIKECKIYAEDKFPNFKKKLGKWYYKHLVFYFISIIIAIRKSQSSGKQLLKSCSILVRYCYVNCPWGFLNIKLIIHFTFLILLGLKRLVI